MINKLKFKPNSLKFKIWIYFIVFSLLILSCLWFLQIIFLDRFYQSAKIKELNNTVEDIKELYNERKLYNSLDMLAKENGICVQIMVGNTITYDASIFNKGCLLDNKNSDYKIHFKQSDKDNETYKLINPRYNNEVLVKAMKISDNTYAFASISLEPLDSAISILKDQFLFVTFVVLVLSLFIAVFLSKKISDPILKINNHVNELAKGNYKSKLKIDVDIDELNELEDTLNKTAVELGKTEDLRREFMANVGHDLKTPLTMIKAYAEMVRDLTYNNKVKREENLNVIIEESDRLNLLVNDIVDLSILQSNVSEFKMESFDITSLISNVLKRYSILKENNDYKFIFDCEDEYLVNADPLRIEQVIYNLLNNAVNYTGNDKTIKVRIVPKDDKYVRVEIIDTGKGITKDDMILIWKKYYKVDKSHRRDKKGTGIGLSIVENILKKHRVKYGVSSIKDEGTTFWFELKRV